MYTWFKLVNDEWEDLTVKRYPKGDKIDLLRSILLVSLHGCKLFWSREDNSVCYLEKEYCDRSKSTMTLRWMTDAEIDR